jgi:hypothetical protein
MSATHRTFPARQWTPPSLYYTVALVLLAAAPVILFFPQTASAPRLWAHWLAIMVLAWWLPGALLALHWTLSDQDLLSISVLALGLGWCWMILIMLIVHWLPGPLWLWLCVGAYEAGALLLLFTLRWRKGATMQTLPRAIWIGLALLLGTALLLRLPGLGYHEFHYDEVLVLTRAREAIRGQDDALARHTKGPGEIAVAIVVYRALGTANETTARLPFALASVASILALFVLGRRLFSTKVGLIAGLLLAANGFALGLSRIVQYQPAMLLLSILAVLAAWEFAQSGQVRWLAMAISFSAFGAIMHYEFSLLLPLLALLGVMGWRRASAKRRVAIAAWWSGAAAAGLVAAAYMPLLLHAFFATTQNYLGIRLGDGVVWNLPFFVEMGAFYNSIYFFAGLVGLAIGGLFLGWRTARLPALLLALWFSPYLALYLWIVRYPGTHFYLLMPAWSLLAALPLAALVSPGALRAATRWTAAGMVALWLGLSIYYLYLMFFRQAPEYLINYKETRNPIYWAPYGENIPEKPRFGFPIREGWKTLGVLAEWNYLGKTYASNEGSNHLRWYLGGFDRVAFDASPDFIFVATHLQEPDPAYGDSWLEDYQRVGEVRVRGEPRIALWARQPLPVPYVTYDAEMFDSIFDTLVPVLRELPEPAPQVREQPLDERITLAAAGVDHTRVAPGQLLHVRLNWRPEQPIGKDLKLFVHLTDAGGRPLVQWDGLPGLNTGRTTLWQAGVTFRDHVVLRIPPDLPAGDYPLLTGLYDPETGARVGGKAVPVVTVIVG